MLLLLVQPADGPITIAARDIEAVFNLTAAEAKLVSALAAGHSLADFAERVGLSRNTVRNQLAAAFTKTETRRQAELVTLVVGRLQWRRMVGGIQ
jgi:DNA-binding CsgD family transcriptional regulator